MPARILDIGAGTGRVSCELARAGHRVTALDIDQDLLDALTARAGSDLRVETVCADAREFTLERKDFDACFVPMQTIQLFGGRDERMSFLRCAATHLRSGGLLACAIVTTVEPFDTSAGEPGPTAETARHNGSLYVSRPTAVTVGDGRFVIERERLILAPDGDRSAPDWIGRDVNELAALDPTELDREGIEAGLHPCGVRAIKATADHVGSEVVTFSA
jgi:SAM-dependent methyltransferase